VREQILKAVADGSKGYVISCNSQKAQPFGSSKNSFGFRSSNREVEVLLKNVWQKVSSHFSRMDETC